MPEYKYSRICLLARCSKPFKTNRENQKFHETECRIEYHQTQKKEAADMLRRIEKLEDDFKQLNIHTTGKAQIKVTLKNSKKEVNDTDTKKGSSSL